MIKAEHIPPESLGEMIRVLSGTGSYAKAAAAMLNAWPGNSYVDAVDFEAKLILPLLAEASGEFVTDVDGFVYYWPKRFRSGHYAAHHLRVLADELDRRNAPWNKQINDYFAQEKTSLSDFTVADFEEQT